MAKNKKGTPDKKYATRELIYQLVYNFKTKYEQGFTAIERHEILLNFPDINMNRFNDALQCITGFVSPKGELITYHCDIEKALQCGMENRGLTNFEFD